MTLANLKTQDPLRPAWTPAGPHGPDGNIQRGMLCPEPIGQAKEAEVPLWTFCETARHPEASSSTQGT